MNLHFSKSNAWQSALIFASGDTIAAMLTHSFSFTRMFGVAIIGATLYTIEIPNYFRWINSHTESLSGFSAGIRRAILGVIYFNPLWIARHLALVQLCSGNFHAITWDLLNIGLRSFIVNLPIGIMANFYIQNKLPLRRRFLASSLFSALMAVYYAMSEEWFK